MNVPTLTSWEDFGISDDDDFSDLPILPRRIVSAGKAPWKDFDDLVIGRR